MRLTLIAALGIVLGQSPGVAVAVEKPVRQVEKAGGFSWTPPKGWKMADPSNETTDLALQAIRDMKKKIEAKKPANRTQAEITQLAAFERMLKVGEQAKGTDQYKSAWGSAAEGPAPSIVFVDFVRNATLNGEKLKTTLADCVAYYKKPPLISTKSERDMFEVVAEKKLKTEAGEECTVVVTNLGSRRMTYYCFDLGGERFLVAACTASWAVAGQGDKLDPVFEASIKTFRLEKP